jgi:hypothetical protein
MIWTRSARRAHCISIHTRTIDRDRISYSGGAVAHLTKGYGYGVHLCTQILKMASKEKRTSGAIRTL